MALVLDTPSKIEHVRRQIQAVPGQRREGTTAVMLTCPFHADSSPSGKVSLNPAYPRSIGWFRCYSCGDKSSMPWDKFAERLGLQPFGPPPDVIRAQPLNEEYLDGELLEDGAQGKTETLDLFPLDREAANKLGLQKTSWRGYPFKFLRGIGGQLCFKHESRRYYVYLPVNVNGVEEGYIKAQAEKPTDKKWPSYLNKPGKWSSSKGLFMFDQSIALMKTAGLKTLVVTEGPRDSLRLFRDGIPAVSLLGTQSWTRAKAMTLALSGADRIVTCLDGDKAGKAATRLIITGLPNKDSERHPNSPPDLRDLLDEVKTFKLWQYAERDGVNDYDPQSMPEDVLEELRKLVI